MTATPPRTLREALADLATATNDLTEPIRRKILRDGGWTTTHVAPSLLDQLRAATGTSGETGGGGRGSTTPIPVDPDAVDLLRQITAEAATAHTYAHHHTPRTIEQDTGAIVSFALHWRDVETIDWAISWLTHWRKLIEDKLDPQQQYHLAAPCPACNARMARRKDPADPEHHQLVTALLVDTRTGVTCQACDAHWPTTDFDRLAELIHDGLPDPTRRPQPTEPDTTGSTP